MDDLLPGLLCVDIYPFVISNSILIIHDAAVLCNSLPIFPQAAGKYRQQGRNYIAEDGDIIFFKFNAGAGLTASKKK